MSLFAHAQKIETAQAVNAEYNKIISNMQSAKAGYTYLQEQSTAMSNDSIYTPEDIAEVNAMITELNLIAVSLTVSEPTPIIPEPIVEVVN